MSGIILFIDCNNLFHKNYHNNVKYGTPEEAVALTVHSSILDIKKYYESHEPLLTILSFDSKRNWRKEYTYNSPNRVTDKKYKGDRSENKTKKQLEAKEMLDSMMEEFAELLRKYSKLVILKKDRLEVDDMASGICRLFGNTEYDIKLITSDKDFLQFLKYDNVELINTLYKGKERTLTDWNNDPELYIFEQCIRGGKNNVRSSYPRVRRTKILEAYYDEFKKTNMMNHEFEETIYDEETDEYVKKQYRVGDIFEENKLLLDLNCQPPDIKQEIEDFILEELSRKKAVNFIKFMRFCKNKGLEKLVSTSQSYIPLLSNKAI